MNKNDFANDFLYAERMIKFLDKGANENWPMLKEVIMDNLSKNLKFDDRSAVTNILIASLALELRDIVNRISPDHRESIRKCVIELLPKFVKGFNVDPRKLYLEYESTVYDSKEAFPNEFLTLLYDNLMKLQNEIKHPERVELIRTFFVMNALSKTSMGLWVELDLPETKQSNPKQVTLKRNNHFSLQLVLIFLILIFGWFYWSQYRPSIITKNCANTLYNQRNSDDYNQHFKQCLQRQGIK